MGYSISPNLYTRLPLAQRSDRSDSLPNQMGHLSLHPVLLLNVKALMLHGLILSSNFATVIENE